MNSIYIMIDKSSLDLVVCLLMDIQSGEDWSCSFDLQPKSLSSKNIKSMKSTLSESSSDSSSSEDEIDQLLQSLVPITYYSIETASTNT